MLKGRSLDQARVDEGLLSAPCLSMVARDGHITSALKRENEGNPFGPPLVFAVIAYALDRLGSNLKTP